MAELQRLDWSEVDLSRGFITVAAHKAKTRQRRLVPIADNLKEWLKPYAKTSGTICLHQRLANCFPFAKEVRLRFVPRLILFLIKITATWENGLQLEPPAVSGEWKSNPEFAYAECLIFLTPFITSSRVPRSSL
jgi:hypothetical protein